MARTFKVASMEVLPKLGNYFDVVINLTFTYGDAQHETGGFIELEPPEGDFIPVDQITEEVALSWLLPKVSHKTAQFDKAIENDIAAKSNVPYERFFNKKVSLGEE